MQLTTTIPETQSKDFVNLPTLTPRQKQVAYLTSLGLANGAIAAELFLAEGTVTSHLSELFWLLNVKTRSELSKVVRDNPQLLYVYSNPPLCLIAWMKQQRLKAALAISDAIDICSDEQLKDDLYKVLKLLQPNEKEQFEQTIKQKKIPRAN